MLVILAILAAIMIPALTGWIDKAKEKQVMLDARNVEMATQAGLYQAYATESTFAKNESGFNLIDSSNTTYGLVAYVNSICGNSWNTNVTKATAKWNEKGDITEFKYTAKDYTATFSDTVWKIGPVESSTTGG